MPHWAGCGSTRASGRLWPGSPRTARGRSERRGVRFESAEGEVGSIWSGWVARGVVRQAHQRRWVGFGRWLLLDPGRGRRDGGGWFDTGLRETPARLTTNGCTGGLDRKTGGSETRPYGRLGGGGRERWRDSSLRCAVFGMTAGAGTRIGGAGGWPRRVSGERQPLCRRLSRRRN